MAKLSRENNKLPRNDLDEHGLGPTNITKITSFTKMTEITNLQEEGPHNCNRNDENNKVD